jgi:hypothetical protein
MKFLHEMMPIVSTKFSEFPRGTGFNFCHLWLQKHSRSCRSAFYGVHWFKWACIEFNRLCSNLINDPCSRFKVDEPTKGRPDEVPSDEVPSRRSAVRRSAVRRSAVPTKCRPTKCRPDEVPSDEVPSDEVPSDEGPSLETSTF